MTDDSRPAFDRVQKFTIETARDWMDWSGIALADVANEDDTPAMKLGAVGFTRAPGGAHSTFDFPYDEVLIVTRGQCTVQTRDQQVTAGPGEVIYLPATVPGSFHADTGVDLVYVASSPYGEVNRDAKAELLGQRAQ
jgi:ethanolamine utilization protein EutQ (cupin superfamily)